MALSSSSVRRERLGPPVRVRSPRTEIGALVASLAASLATEDVEGGSVDASGFSVSEVVVVVVVAGAGVEVSESLGSSFLGCTSFFSRSSRVSVGGAFPRPLPRPPLPRPRPLPPLSPFAGPRGVCCDWASPPDEGRGSVDSGGGCVSMGFCSMTGSGIGTMSSSKKRSSVPAVWANGSIEGSP